MAINEQEFQALLREIAEGSEEAARKFLDLYGEYILRVIRRRLDQKLRVRYDSEDFLQDVYASFFRKPPPPEAFAEPQALVAFLAKLAKNKIVGAYRQSRGRNTKANENSLEGSAQVRVQSLPGPEPTPSAEAVAKEEWLGMLKKHPQQEKILHLLRSGYTHQEIAHLLQLNAKRVQRLKNRLRTGGER
jgi:RNA polymerase sigma factor (sigma-70 family)